MSCMYSYYSSESYFTCIDKTRANKNGSLSKGV